MSRSVFLWQLPDRNIGGRQERLRYGGALMHSHSVEFSAQDHGE
jgi:hypothetical protein